MATMYMLIKYLYLYLYNTRDIKLCSININSIRGEKLELQSFLEISGFDLVAIQEAKIDSSVLNAELLPPELGYSIFRKDHVMGGGGVLLAVKSDLNPTPCLILDITPPESIWMKIASKGHVHYFGCYCRPPDEHYEEIQSLNNQLGQICSFHPPQSQPSIRVMGDFNFRKIDWETHLTKEGEVLRHSYGLILIDIMQDHYLDQLITFPTREDKILDLIFTNTPGLANNCHLPDKFSDHSAVACTLNTSIPFMQKPRRKVYLFNRGDYDSLRSELQEFQESFLRILISKKTGNYSSLRLRPQWTGTFHKKMVSGRSKLSRLSARLRRLIQQKNRIHTKCKKTGNHRPYTLWCTIKEKSYLLTQI